MQICRVHCYSEHTKVSKGYSICWSYNFSPVWKVRKGMEKQSLPLWSLASKQIMHLWNPQKDKPAYIPCQDCLSQAPYQNLTTKGTVSSSPYGFSFCWTHTWIWYYLRRGSNRNNPDMQLWELYSSDDNSKNLNGRRELTWIELSVPSSVLGPLQRFSYLMFINPWCWYYEHYFPDEKAETCAFKETAKGGNTTKWWLFIQYMFTALKWCAWHRTRYWWYKVKSDMVLVLKKLRA